MAPSIQASLMSQKRIQKEIADLRKEDMGDMQLAPSETNTSSWHAAIPGPEGSGLAVEHVYVSYQWYRKSI